MKSASFSIWLDAARPKTLPLALASIITGSALAYWQGYFSISIAIMALITATLLQILSNLANDYGDAVKGTDNDERLGPTRAIQSGLVSANAMKTAMAVNIALTIVSGLVLIALSFTTTADIISFIGLGLLAIVAAIAYTVGNKPYGYRGLGDLSVLIFFGWLGVAGSYYLHTGQLDLSIFLPATACGLLAVGVLNVNNLRDIDNDHASGKMTLIVRMGPQWGRKYHLSLLFGSMLCLSAFISGQFTSPLAWLFLAASPLLLKHAIAVYQAPDGHAIRPMMPVIVQCALLTNLLFAMGLILS